MSWLAAAPIGRAVFVRALRPGSFEDLDGAAMGILIDGDEEKPALSG